MCEGSPFRSMRSSLAVMLAIIAITAGRPVGRRDRQLQSDDPTETHPSTARRREGNATELQAPRSCASYPVAKGKSNCPKDRCIFAGWFCAPLPTGQAAGSNAAACERQSSKDACASAGGDGTCRCTWGSHPIGKAHGKSAICYPRPAFTTPADTCTVAAVEAINECDTKKTKASCPKDICTWGGWFCQPLPTGHVYDGTNFGACEKSRTEESCSASGGDGKCRCTWGVHPFGKVYKRPGSLICSPNPTFGTPSALSCDDAPTSTPATAPTSAPTSSTVAPAASSSSSSSSTDAADNMCAAYASESDCPAELCKWDATSKPKGACMPLCVTFSQAGRYAFI